MEQADIQRLQNLVDLIEKKAKWELDDAFRKLLNETINCQLITIYDDKIYYHKYPMRILTNFKDVFNWRNRKVGQELSIGTLQGFSKKILTTFLRHKFVILTDDLLILSAAVHVVLTPEEIQRPYFNNDYAYADTSTAIAILPTELRKQLKGFIKETEVKEK